MSEKSEESEDVLGILKIPIFFLPKKTSLQINRVRTPILLFGVKKRVKKRVKRVKIE